MALFIVLGTIATLMVVVVEFTYIAQVNLQVSYGGSDELRARYIAYSGVKDGLVRLAAADTLKQSPMLQKMPGAESMVDMIWKFNLADLKKTASLVSPDLAAKVAKIDEESALTASPDVKIHTKDTSKMNLNWMLSSQAMRTPQPQGGDRNGAPPQTAVPQESPQQIRQAKQVQLEAYLRGALRAQEKVDPGFEEMHRDFRLQDFVLQLVAYVDPDPGAIAPGMEPRQLKHAPLDDISELQLFPNVDGALFRFFNQIFSVLPVSDPSVDPASLSVVQLLIFFPDLNAEDAGKVAASLAVSPQESGGGLQSAQVRLEQALARTLAYAGAQTRIKDLIEEMKKQFAMPLSTKFNFFTIESTGKSGNAAVKLTAKVRRDEPSATPGRPPSTPGGVNPLAPSGNPFYVFSIQLK
jgi:hypothetical protein